MANIYCSLKLKEFLKPIIENNIKDDEQWNGHIFYLESKKCILFLNKETIYSFVLFEVLIKDIKNIRRLFIDGFINQFYADGILDQENDLILRMKYENLIFLSTNNDKSAIGSINDCIARIKFSSYSNKKNIKEAKFYVEKYLNNIPMGAIKFNYPSKIMK